MEFITPILNGFPVQGTEADGTEWSLHTLDGWWEPTDSTGETFQNSGRDGGWVDEAYSTSRTLVVGGLLIGASRPAARAAWERLVAAIPVKDLAPLVVHEDGLVRHCLVRQEHKPAIVWLSNRIIKWSVQLSAPGFRKLAGDGTARSFSSGPVRLPKTTGGKRLKPGGIRTPFRIVATVRDGSAVLGTSGKATPPTLVRIMGPLPDFTITATTGSLIQAMRYTEPVPAGQYVDVDLDKRQVRINGAVSRRNKLVGAWITPEDGTVFKFDSSVQNDTASMELFASSAWR